VTTHADQLLGAYALGILDDTETRAVDEHLAGCAQCRAELTELRDMETALGDLPPEAFLDGPPEDGDLLLQRTLRQVRTESARAARPRQLVAVAAAVVGLAVMVGAGFAIGKATAPASVIAGPTVTVAPPTTTVPGTRNLQATDPSGAAMRVNLIPAAGWVRVHATVTGIPAGQKCRLLVISTSGTTEQAGSWLVSPKGATEGTPLDGAALIAPDQVASVVVENTDGKRFVTVPA
jgi:anti-sigma factor RsiW